MVFFTCDVFTGQRFGGNPLAVLPDASGLTAEQMQAIAREFNYSETTFVLAENNLLGERGPPTSLVFEEAAGLVSIEIETSPAGAIRCELKAPESLQIGRAFPVEYIARILSLFPADIDVERHNPQVASVGLPYVVIAVHGRDALERVSVDLAVLGEFAADGVDPWLYVYCRSADAFDLRGRMFAPLSGTPEDPATGSACCALAGLLGQYDAREDGDLTWRIAQGVEMRRPSVIDARCRKRRGAVESVRIAGACVSVSRGHIRVER